MEVKSQCKILILGIDQRYSHQIEKELNKLGFENILIPSKKKLNIYDYNSSYNYILGNRPDYIFYLSPFLTKDIFDRLKILRKKARVKKLILFSNMLSESIDQEVVYLSSECKESPRVLVEKCLGFI